MLVGLLVFAGACGAPGATSAQDDDGSAGPGPEVQRLTGSSDWATDFSKRSVPLEEIVSGGPPKDGIPAIDDPSFVSPSTTDRWLEPRSPVMVVERNGEAKAYPLAILMYHEIVNDRVGGVPVAVTYCPLCNTALAFDRRVGDRTLDFGTTGRLRHSDLVMYDRQTESWWQQASGEAIVGELTGTRLEFLPTNTLSWERARALHPDLVVLSRDTRFARQYGTNPYAGYDRAGNRPMTGFFREEVDPRLPAMERVAAVRLGDGWAAPFSELEKTRGANAEAGENDPAAGVPDRSSPCVATRDARGRSTVQRQEKVVQRIGLCRVGQDGLHPIAPAPPGYTGTPRDCRTSDGEDQHVRRSTDDRDLQCGLPRVRADDRKGAGGFLPVV